MKYFDCIFKRKTKNKFFNENNNKVKQLTVKKNSEQWQDCGDIFYLLDTLKLTYESTEGLVTIEKLSKESLNDLMGGQLPLLEKIQTSQCITLSVCAVSLQNLANKKRTKAISDAAFLRLFKDRGLQSQAQFHHPELPLDNKADALTRYDFKRGINTVYDLSLSSFITVLTKKNADYISKFGRNSSVKSDNFDRIFTNYELQKVSAISLFSIY
ncbi:hypothetical protein CJF42_08800 [Pseudoalteromonas sp. NBT06-2]|uniref:hypothetical protein n=1 Tax=Pseudoalteromonas sp. NBT06-2 TaxID=2025950 RepID=UPI000BA6F5CE|nr:hypothetical protein [Pseudoalteromonas sp. NBT06-2]PAJ74769.1 hypothetical protein CJF42_08800 [Pseudoalteromonas sp. NBT06-2]